MTYAPSQLRTLRDYLHDKTGLSFASLGIVGDADHHGGYHNGADRVSRDDYSVDESPRDADGLSLAASAIDIGSFSRLRELSKWLVVQCGDNAVGTADIREIIYSTDGKTVKRWDRLGKRSSGDSSHLYHTHISFFRDAVNHSQLALFRRFFEGIETAPNPPAQQPPANTDRFKESLMALPTIKRGSKGEHVKTVQGLLNSFGYGLKIDADFGPKTESAVERFQVKYKVPNSVKNGKGDGLVGPSTRIYLNRAD